MNEFNPFFFQAYLWLPLLGGLHCLILCTYIRFIHQPRTKKHHLLTYITGLLALYFFTGLISQHNTSIPINILFTLIMPIYFLFMPLMYLYCKEHVTSSSHDNFNWKHFYPTVGIVILLVLTLSNHRFIAVNSFENIGIVKNFNIIFIVFPGLLSLQAVFYFILIFRLLNKLLLSKSPLENSALHHIKFKWLLILTFALIMNWLVINLLLMLPFYTDNRITVFNLLLTQIILLISLYILAFYGLKQMTDIAYMRDQNQSSMNPIALSATTQAHLLTEEELDFIHQVINKS
ncbi:hypothetical protein [uncultured Shewanella sp.]|uniref:hypothetical protein n=1 Tax=uncultured Shewanella sp. TaxID=173975 RepID=UPI0026171AFC|nr:hypothetical protein [uncultured Shewanella sp.]